jgi:hypothetical protein
MRLIAHRLNHLLDRLSYLVDRLEFASYDEYLAALSATIRDARAAFDSSLNLGRLTLRPAWIFGGIICRCLYVVLVIIARHTVAHGYVAFREGYYQIRTGTVWFVRYQGSLSNSARYAELGLAASLTMLWLLRRHVRRRRYVERISAWYENKKRRALRRYLNLVERVARTSSFMALLLPHLMYAVLIVGLRRLMPSVVTYLATRTYLCSIISFWHPLYMTISLLGRLLPILREYKDDESPNNSNSMGEKSGRDGTVTPSTLKQRRRREMEMETLRVEVIDLLEYWVVYAVLLAIVRTGRLLPFIGHVLNATTDVDSTTTVSKKGLFGKIPRARGLYTRLRLSGKFVEEATLVFFVWLRHMPSFVAGDEVKHGITRVLSPKEPMPVEFRNGNSGRPVDILYGKLSPAVLATINSSAFLTRKKVGVGEVRGKESTFVSMAIQKLHSFLDVLVLVRMISKESQDWLITTIVESSALLPALTTLLMPGYFTNYGVIYVSLVVPAGYSISSCDAIRNTGQSQGVETMMRKFDDSSRYLQFWIVHAALSMLLASFAPVLAWIPLSTHAAWLLWAYVQLQSSTRKIYGWFEGELGKKSLSETAVARSTRWVIAALPSNVKGDGESNDTPKLGGEKSKDD